MRLISLLKILRKRQKSHDKLSKLLDIDAEKPHLRRPVDASRVINRVQVLIHASRQICYLIKVAMARREPFARHRNVYLRRYRVYIRSTLHAHYITVRRSRGAVKPGGRRYFSAVSCLARIVFKVDSFTRIRDGAACCLPPRESRHRSYPLRASTPSHPRSSLCGRERF